MFTKIYWIHQYENGARIGIMPRPRGNEWLEQEISMLKKQRVGHVVSLLELEEIRELGLTKEQRLCENAGINFINFPIRDRDVPSSQEKLNFLISELSKAIENGSCVIIHCRMGIGRATIIAGCVLLKSRFKTYDIIQKIGKARGFQVPDTEAQIKWLMLQENLQKN